MRMSIGQLYSRTNLLKGYFSAEKDFSMPGTRSSSPLHWAVLGQGFPHRGFAAWIREYGTRNAYKVKQLSTAGLPQHVPAWISSRETWNLMNSKL
jgi:hypothetical protein